MLRTVLFHAMIPAVVLLALLSGPATQTAAADTYRAAITIYNKTGIELTFQVRAYRNGEWTDWKTLRHQHPNGGWKNFWYDNAEKLQIRFDRIGGDDEYTEKIYDLTFNRVDPNEEPGRYDGRPYYFDFDAGGSLLDLKRYEW